MALDRQELIRFKVNIENIGEMANEDLDDLYDCNLKFSDESIDSEAEEKPSKATEEK